MYYEFNQLDLAQAKLEMALKIYGIDNPHPNVTRATEILQMLSSNLPTI